MTTRTYVYCTISFYHVQMRNHKVRTLHNKTPLQVLTMCDFENRNVGITLNEMDMHLFEDVNEYEDIVNGVNQVVCESRYNPFTVEQYVLYCEAVTPIPLNGVFLGDLRVLFDRFSNALSIAVNVMNT